MSENMEAIKAKIRGEIEKSRAYLLDFARAADAAPETGYREYKTAGLVKDAFDRIGLPYTDGLAQTGVKARLKGNSEGKTIAVMGELDAVVCPAHPKADRQTGAAHACGHNLQLAIMLGAAIGLSAVRNELRGDAVFFAVPAEEMVELEFREGLIIEGKIKYMGGKQELIRIGAFEDIDAALMVHAMNSTENKASVNLSSLGFIAKTVRFTGREAHAGGAPHEGINALNAAMAALMCIHAARETFRDEDGVRVHPIITKGGDLVNIVPADVRMETYVRAKNTRAMKDASQKVDRAIHGAAYAVGAKAEINDIPGYLPLLRHESFGDIFYQNACTLLGTHSVLKNDIMQGSTDAGDLSHIMPVIQPVFAGVRGGMHSREFEVYDYNLSVIKPAQAVAMTVADILCAADGERAINGFERINPAQYEAIWEEMLTK